MCMKYVNVNVRCAEQPNFNLFSQLNSFRFINTIKSEKKDDRFIIGNFNICTFINIRGTNIEDNKENPISNKKKLFFKIRLTKMNKDVEKQLSYDIRDFIIDLNKEKLESACFSSFEVTDITDVKEISLKDIGNYVIKILVKDEENKLYDIQTLHHIKII